MASMPPSSLGLQPTHPSKASEGDGMAQVPVGVGSIEHAEYCAAPCMAAKAGSVYKSLTSARDTDRQLLRQG